MLFVILSVGREPRLLRERKAVLATAGYIVVSAYGPEDGIDKFVAGDFDLVLVCPSLGKDALRLTNAMRRYRPSVPVVIVSESECQVRPSAVHSVVCSSDGLLATIHEVLANGHGLRHLQQSA